MGRPPNDVHFQRAPVDRNTVLQQNWETMSTDMKLDSLRADLISLRDSLAQVHADAAKVHKLLAAFFIQPDGSITLQKNLNVQSDADITFS